MITFTAKGRKAGAAVNGANRANGPQQKLNIEIMCSKNVRIMVEHVRRVNKREFIHVKCAMAVIC